MERAVRKALGQSCLVVDLLETSLFHQSPTGAKGSQQLFVGRFEAQFLQIAEQGPG